MIRVPITLTNRSTIFHCPPEIQSKLKEHFRYFDPKAERTYRYQMKLWDGFKNLMQRGRVGSGLFLDQYSGLRKAGFQFQIVKDERKKLRFEPLESYPELGNREYQKQAVEKMISRSYQGGIILNATGTGKTRLAAGFLRLLKGLSVFVVDELTLLDQARREIAVVTQEEIGIVGRSEFLPKRLTVATIQTLDKHRKDPGFKSWFSSLDAVILDEIHLALNKRNIDIITAIKPHAVYGLTATLEIEKPEVRMRACALAGPPIFEYPLQQAVAEGYLTDGLVMKVCFQQQESKVWDWQQLYYSQIVGNADRNACIETLIRAGVQRGHRVVALFERIPHLKHLSKRLQDVPHAMLYGGKKSEERTEAIQRMDRGELALILASRVFGKGVDIRTVDVIIDCTGLPSPNSAIQRYGRGTRTAEGKQHLLHIDIADQGGLFGRNARSREQAFQRAGIPVESTWWSAHYGASAYERAISFWKSRGMGITG